MHGLKRMKHYGGAQPGHRTLVDALQPALEALAAGESLAAAAAAAQRAPTRRRRCRVRRQVVRLISISRAWMA